MMYGNQLIWKSQKSENDNSVLSPQSHDVLCNCGQLLGQLDELMPFIYIANCGAYDRDMRMRQSDVVQGIFAVGQRTVMRDNEPGVSPRLGLLLPVNRCHDERARAALLKIFVFINSDSAINISLAEKRRHVQAYLDEAFDGEVKLDDGEKFDGFMYLTPTAGLFQRLHTSFEYIIEVIDNPNGLVRVVKAAPFHWKSYGEVMEWYHFLHDLKRFDRWETLTPYFVYGNTGTLPSYNTERWASEGLLRPDEHPAKWFVLRPDIPDALFSMHLEMENAGWASLYLTLNDVSIRISLSYVFDPFPALAAWIREIYEGDLPVAIEIDEEGVVATLMVLTTDDPQRVLLRVTRKYGLDEEDNTILLEGVVRRSTLDNALRAELRRFFMTEFDPQAWYWDGKVGGIKSYILDSQWLRPSL